jgi:LmbE family N-acetylglucosaminyl deacetylase
MHTAMVISPHADDAAAFCGGMIARLADEGWKIVLVRVTDDSRDSVGLTMEETLWRNAEELREASKILGVSGIEDLGFETDRLADVPLCDLRERIVYQIRKHQPYAVFGFDPGGLYEGNQDHVRVALATEEAYWVAAFDLHHPEHFNEGFEPFSVCERWYFARELAHPNRAEDVSAHMQRRVDALCAHRTMIANLINGYRLQLKTWGRRLDWLDQSMTGDPHELIAMFLQAQAKAVAARHGLPEGTLAEEYRLVRFGELEEIFQGMSVPIEGADAAPVREGLDRARPHPARSPEQVESIFPCDSAGKVRLMGHHFLCVGAFEELATSTIFNAGYPDIIDRIKPAPDLKVEAIYGYDIFCYQCGFWSEDEGRCTTGWRDKLAKDTAVLKQLGIETGEVLTLAEVERRLAERIGPEGLERFCGPGPWRCEFKLLGKCRRGYERLRDKYRKGGA